MMSAQVNSALLPSSDAFAGRPANDESLRMPHDALTPVLNGVGTLCTSSMTESIAPAVPQYTLKSAERYTVAVMPSRSRMGKPRTVLYAWIFQSTSTLARAPAVIFPVMAPGLQPPADGLQFEPLGFVVFSFAAPVHHRGPFNAEFAGSALASPRPGPAENHGGAVVIVAPPNSE